MSGSPLRRPRCFEKPQKMIKWVFFDIGSTLVDESECEAARIADTVRGSAITAEEFDALYRSFCAQNLDGYDLARKRLGLAKAKWRPELERLYPGVKEMLARMAERYRLGVIANQHSGLSERLESFGIGSFFDVSAGSGDIGAAKPDPEIFRRTLALAGCDAREAVMVGDRPDNDIAPAQALGMRTVWVRQGYGGLGNAGLLPHPPDIICRSITELTAALLCSETREE